MSLSPNRIRKLRALRQRDLLEVEHVVEVAVYGSGPDASLLDELIPNDEDALLLNWKSAAIEFLRGGYGALLAYADAEVRLPFVVGMLEELKTIESVAVLLQLAVRFPVETALVTAALNLVLSFDEAPTLHSELEAELREFLHDQVRRADSEPRRATAILALRRPGDGSTLELLATQPDFSAPYQNTLKLTRRTIRQRLAKQQIFH